jgi:hypothetical protein
LASSFVTSKQTLTKQNGGIQLIGDRFNKFDKYAIEVRLATRYDNGYTWHQCVGFIPRRLCTKCSKSFGGKHSQNLVCPYCAADLSNDRMSWFNKFIVERYADRSVPINYAVWWINQNPQVKDSSWGCSLALQLPPTELTPPK